MNNSQFDTNKEVFKKIYAQIIGRPLGMPGDSGEQHHLDTGKPYTHYENRTKEQLYNMAREMHIEGRSNLSKAELIDAVREHRH